MVIALKAIVLIAAALALLGTMLLLFVSALGNGSAIGSEHFSWIYAIVSRCVVGSQAWLITIGLFGSWRRIDELDKQVYAHEL